MYKNNTFLFLIFYSFVITIEMDKLVLEIRSKVVKNEPLDSDSIIKFKESYPKFYNMLIVPSINEGMLKKLLELLSSIECGSCDSFTASTVFSQYGAEQYIYNENLQKPSDENINEARKKLKQY